MQDPMPTDTFMPRRETLFEQMSRKLAQMIDSGVWKAGDMLPNETDLADRFNVSPGTARRALKLLVDQGVLVRQQGKGTFVARFDRTPSQVLARFVRLIPDANAARLPMRTEQPLFEVGAPTEEAAEALKLMPGEEVIHVQRVHYTDRGPVSFDEFYLNRSVFHALTAENMLHHKERLLYAFYQSVCGVTITHCEATAKAEVLSEERCRRYGLPWPTPLICERRTTYALGDRPVEYRIQEYITRDHHFKLD